MDEQTKHIVAAILTVGYCANRPSVSSGGFRDVMEAGSHFPMSVDQIVTTYRTLLSGLDSPATSESSSEPSSGT